MDEHYHFFLWPLRENWKVSKYEVFSGPYFPAFGLNTERHEVSLRIQSECGKIRTKKNSVFGYFPRSGPYLHQACFVSYVLERVVDLTTLNIMRITRAMLMKFCIVNPPRCQILIWVWRVFCSFQQTFTCE